MTQVNGTNGNVISSNDVNGTNGINDTNGVNGHSNGTNGHANGFRVKPSKGPAFEPIAICGIACRLPGGISSPKGLWNFLMEGRDARTRVPRTRFNINGYYSPVKRPGTTNTEFGYFLDPSVDLAGLDTSFLNMTRTEIEWLDPQQRLMLEVVRESLDDAGEVSWKGSNIGVYMGNFTQDWYDIMIRDGLRHSHYAVTTSHDFMISERVSHEMDLRGPSLTIRTACSSALTGLNEACMAIARDDCESAIVGGSSLILAPDMTTRLSDQGVLSPDGSCKTFSADANGYARGEAITAVYVKSLRAALRDGNPIRSVISGSAINFDGNTNPLTMPSATSQEALIRRAYEIAGISDASKTALFECHGTGTYAGDPIETEAIASIFGEEGIYLGAVKPNLGHSEGASGLTAVIKATLALEHRTIPPNIKYSPLNPRIPFERAKLRIPEQPTQWPAGRDERVSINAFGVGGANAHVIIESKASFLDSRQTAEPERTTTNEPQLLLFSANTVKSLKNMERNYQSLVEETSLDVANVSYTLATRREHLTHRSFAVATRGKFTLPPSVSPPEGGRAAPSLVMVFTGQGASWPQFGRALLLSNSTFSRTIQSLDAHLQSLGAVAPSWSLKEELLKPTRTSRVHEAEFSQPLCTALQLALVDTIVSVGIKPAAVVGHSSGEIAAAYAIGALTAREAITVAFHRGAVAKGHTERGGMAAVGLGWEEIQQHLVPGVITACDNSPSSVTLSGDADKLDTVVSAIKESHPNVPATTLKVEKAYHSHHMLALGGQYHRAMVDSGVVGKVPSMPFFSSVTGELLGSAKGAQLGPKYWQANLERPVLFRSAVSGILRSEIIKNEVFLEIGPHSALAGPLRQILTSESSKAPYIPSLVRRQNSVENLLQAIGKLYTLHVDMNFKSLVPDGSCVTDLPCYPWDHSRRHWFESRVSKEWRGKEYPDHSLLGTKLPECTEFEPAWRNLLQVNTVPWVLDHMVGETIVFPLSGYVSMAAEAARQVTGIEDGVSFRNVAVNNALVLAEDGATEVITTMRRQRLTDSLNSEWWEFTISSHNGLVWTKHCSGEVRGETFDMSLEHVEQAEELPRNVDAPKWYDAERRAGLFYGPSFAVLERIRSSTGQPHKATATMKNNIWGDETEHHLHPVILDGYFQLMSLSVYDGIGRHYRRLLASKIDSMTIFRCAEDELKISTTSEPTDEGYIGEGLLFAGSKTVLRISGSRLSLFDETEGGDESSTSVTARCEWVPHIDFKNNSDLIRPPHGREASIPLLTELAQSAIDLASETVRSIDVHTPHFIKYKEWLNQQARSDLGGSDVATLTQEIESLVERLQETSAGPVARAIAAISRNIESLLKGEKTALEVLNNDGGLDHFTEFLSGQDDSDYLRCIAHIKANIRVLEVGAGLGDKTLKIVNSLTRVDGQPLYSQYVVTDKLSGFLSTAQERLKGVPNMEFTVLDVSESMTGQTLEGRQFDLILATNVINKCTSIQESLGNLHGLLSPRGRLILDEPRPGLSWTKFALGTLPGWWSSSEDLNRVEEPFIGPERWQKELAAAGFAEIDHIEPDSEHWTSNVLVARPQHKRTPTKRVTVLCDGTESGPNLIINELEGRGYKVDRCSLGQIPKPGQDVLALLEEELPFFEEFDLAKMSEFKSFLNHLRSAGLLWVTRPSNIGCTDPRYAQVIGLVRTLRSEMAIDIATLETEKIVSPLGAIAVADVLGKFQTREEDGALDPDYEYAIHNGQTLVNRIFPFSLEQELLVSHESNEAVVSQTHPGRLDTLTWSTKSAPAPKDDEVEVEVYASGLNFRDVLVGMQIIPGRHEPKFGYEAAGIVRRVGPNVTKLRVGDRAAVVGINAFATVITGREEYYEKLPDNISFVEGACIPTIFITAVYGLIDLGHLSKGQSVLIHSGAGGVGLAAIQVARMLGAEIYTTVGSEGKAQYLTDTFGIPRNRILNSRNSSFVDDLLRETDGKGVDVALNSLAGELLHATWKCVAKWGTMVEIGKRDLLGNAQLDMRPFLDNRNYCCLDVEQMRIERPKLSSRSLKFAMDCFSKGHFKPIRVDKVFSAPAILDAFRYMQQGKHIGKIVLEIRDAKGKLAIKDVDSTKKTGAELDGAASYLLIGGLGGLGRAMSVWMVEHGAKNLTFLSRSAGSGNDDANFAREIESMGCTVQMIQGDVAQPDDVARAVNGTLAPLKGIVQMSMVLRDQMFDGMNIEDWNAVTRPKVQGTWNLHSAALARGLDLDFFLLFSSLSGIHGQVGQANYASANTFLDAFAHYRASMNLPCTTIDLGAMEDIGYLSENQDLLRKMQGTGWRAVQEVELLRTLDLAMMSLSTRNQRRQSTTIGDVFLLGLAPTVPLSSSESSALQRKDVRLAVYHNISGSGLSKGGSAADGLRALLATARKDPSLLRSNETAQLLAMEIGKKLFSLVLAGDVEVDIAMRTADVGLDSLVAVEMQAWWKLNFGFDISTMEMLSMGTLEALGRRAAVGLIALHDA
ncbi:hypothetical protein AJ79_09216 [Helicocarpus griseus UAMH5409]|uniref:Neosartoricin B biosynthesis protein A n=1 Tax=Helicocarpus griseus UAMH5409 TaxID=1447875 RepID=A0A2B7WL82_9EURO|nr:hypothetical protein AJ79_09216 [Helicocarpus griseus UAMH5409]